MLTRIAVILLFAVVAGLVALSVRAIRIALHERRRAQWTLPPHSGRRA